MSDEAEVIEANARFYRAFEALDIHEMDRVWAHGPHVNGAGDVPVVVLGAVVLLIGHSQAAFGPRGGQIGEAPKHI